MESEFLANVVGVVEATSFEKSCLWANYAKKGEEFGRKGTIRYSWQENLSGYGKTVGYLNENPICISLLTAAVNGKKLLFWHATSQVVDYDQIDKWLKENLPKSAFREDGYLNKTDAENFHILV